MQLITNDQWSYKVIIEGMKNGRVEYPNRGLGSIFSQDYDLKLPLSNENDRFRDLNNTGLSTSSGRSSHHHRNSLLNQHKGNGGMQKKATISPAEIEESIEDSLEQLNPSRQSSHLEQRIKTMAVVFQLLKQLKNDQKNRTLAKQLSRIENMFLSLEREFLQEEYH